MEKMIFKMADELKELNASDGHFTANNIRHTKGITAVVSVYDNIKPAYKVLEELYEWAIHNDPELKKRIEDLEKDMSWNEDNPV